METKSPFSISSKPTFEASPNSEETFAEQYASFIAKYRQSLEEIKAYTPSDQGETGVFSCFESSEDGQRLIPVFKTTETGRKFYITEQ